MFHHEFAHGVSNIEGAAQHSSLVAKAINEAISDYVGSIVSGSCLGDSIITSPSASYQGDYGNPAPAGCLRHFEPDVKLSSSFYQSALDTSNWHRMGQVVGSALWDARTIGGQSLVYDRAFYHALRYYIPTNPSYIMYREAIAEALKDFEKANEFSVSSMPSYYTEQEFYANEVGAPAVYVSNVTYSNGVFRAFVTGPPNLSVRARMFAGLGLNNDNSVASITDQGDNEPTFVIGANGTATVTPGQLGWHGARTHSPTDGHEHSARIAVTATNSLTGELHYFGAYGAIPPDMRRSIVASTSPDHSFKVTQTLGRNRSAPSLDKESGVALTDARAIVRRSGVTGLRFSIPEPAHVSVRVYDLRGRLIRTAIDGPFLTGTHDWTWDGDADSGERVQPGTYIALVTSGEQSARTVLVLR